MSDYNQTRDAAGNVTSQYGQMLRDLDDDLVERLHDRRVCSPAQNSCRNAHILNQAADRIEQLEAKLKWAEISSIQADRIEELQAQRNFAQRQVVAAEVKLARAVETLEFYAHVDDDQGVIARRTLAELRGETDE